MLIAVKNYVLDILHGQEFMSTQPIKIKFRIRPVVTVAATLVRFDIVMTNRKFSVSSDGQKMFEFS